MTTPPNPAGNAEITDEFSDGGALALSAASDARTATWRIAASFWAATRSSCCATAPRPSPPGWRRSRRRASRISLEMYIFSDDAIGRQFADALIAAPPGAASRCGCSTTSSAAATRRPSSSTACASHGVHVIAYHRYRFWRPRFWALLRRNHRKTLVCDGRIAFAGGLNISNEWVSAGRRRRRLARRRHPGRRPGGRRHRGDLPAHLEPAREEVGAPRSRPRARAGRRRRDAAGA